MTEQAARHRGWYWQRYTDGGGAWSATRGRAAAQPPGEELAALRSGLGRAAGTAPRMWPFYATVIDDKWLRSYTDTWEPPVELTAEHHTLTLYGLHQQSQRLPVHRRGIGVGTAVGTLRDAGGYSPEAVTRRFTAAATATSVNELALHLRGLVQQMRSLGGSRSLYPLDYTQLRHDLLSWAYPHGRARVRRRWGLQYFARSATSAGEPAPRPRSTAATP